MFFLTWHPFFTILTFSRNALFYFHTAISLDIELKMNVDLTYVHSIYVLFPGECEGASKLVLLSKSFQTTAWSKLTRNTPKKDGKLVQV